MHVADSMPVSEAFKDAAACLYMCAEEQRAPTEEVLEKAMPHARRLVNCRQQDAPCERPMAMFAMNDPHSLKGAHPQLFWRRSVSLL